MALFPEMSLGLMSEASTSGLGSVLYAAEEQHRRSLRMMHNLARQAEVEAEKQAAWEHKQAIKEARAAQIALEQEAERKARLQAAAETEAHRRARHQAAVEEEERRRQQAQMKVEAVEHRVNEFEVERQLVAERNRDRASKVAARRSAALQQSVNLAEMRRSEFEARQATADNLMRQKEELRQLEAQIKAEEAFLKQQGREATKIRAGQELSLRTSVFIEKGHQKECALEQRRKESEAVRRLKVQEARARQEYIQLQAREAAELDLARRDRIRAQLTDKAARVDAIVAQREALAKQMQRVRHSMAQQEGAIRASLELLRRSGASFALPPDVARALDVPGGPSAFLASPRNSRILSPRGGLMSPANGSRSSTPTRPASAHLAASAAASPAMYTPPQHAKRAGGSVYSPGAVGAGAFTRVRPTSASAVLLRRSGGGAGSSPRYNPAWPGRAGTGGAQGGAGTGAGHYTTAGPVAGTAVSRREEELRRVLREEIDKETERQAILSGTRDGGELMRLNKVFTYEREAAKRRILALSSAVHAAAAAALTAPSPKGLVSPVSSPVKGDMAGISPVPMPGTPTHHMHTAHAPVTPRS